MPTTLAVQGRHLDSPRAAKGVAYSDSTSSARAPLGAADYLAIATHFHTLILAGVPRLSPEQRNEARRFITLIDALYEHAAIWSSRPKICRTGSIPGATALSISGGRPRG